MAQWSIVKRKRVTQPKQTFDHMPVDVSDRGTVWRWIRIDQRHVPSFKEETQVGAFIKSQRGPRQTGRLPGIANNDLRAEPVGSGSTAARKGD